jgi:hypothetical protein
MIKDSMTLSNVIHMPVPICSTDPQQAVLISSWDMHLLVLAMCQSKCNQGREQLVVDRQNDEYIEVIISCFGSSSPSTPLQQLSK